MGAGAASATAASMSHGFKVDTNIETDQDQCSHPMLYCWEGVYVCMDCWYKLNDCDEAKQKHADRVREENELCESTCDDYPTDLSEGELSNWVGQQSANRGVSIGFLLQFTQHFDCWEWSSAEMIRNIIKPATRDSRCRFVELSQMKEYTGPAKTFISYAQAGKWGDLVAAVLDGGADLNRCVWIDIFAVRQWPSKTPDLDFASTISHCSSFLVVCSSQKEVQDMDEVDTLAGKSELLSPNVRRQICFMRVWCLVEAHKACSMLEMPYIMKAGSHRLTHSDGIVEFIPNKKMLSTLMSLVNIEKAEATVESDRARILSDIRKGVGVQKLNSTIQGSIMGAAMAGAIKNYTTIQCAACGDSEAMQLIRKDTESSLGASAGGFTRLLRELLDDGYGSASIDEKTNHGRTSLIWASIGGHEECVRLLLEKGANVDEKENNDMTSLMYASFKGHEACVLLLLEKGASIDEKSNNACTSLMVASIGGHGACVKLLLEKGASIDEKEKNDMTSLMYASFKGHEAVVRLLLEKGAVIEEKDNYGGTSLMHASNGGHDICVRLMLEKGANTEEKDNNGRTSLMMASQQCHEACIMLLLEKGASIDEKDKDGYTSLMGVSAEGHVACVGLLLEKGANIDEKDKDGLTSLMYASDGGHEACMLLLLEKGANVEEKDNYGQTSLMLASKKGHKACVQLLKEKMSYKPLH